MQVRKQYDFPNGIIKAYTDGTYREFPKWCMHINVVRSRDYVASVLKMKREHTRRQLQALKDATA